MGGFCLVVELEQCRSVTNGAFLSSLFSRNAYFKQVPLVFLSLTQGLHLITIRNKSICQTHSGIIKSFSNKIGQLLLVNVICLNYLKKNPLLNPSSLHNFITYLVEQWMFYKHRCPLIHGLLQFLEGETFTECFM